MPPVLACSCERCMAYDKRPCRGGLLRVQGFDRVLASQGGAALCRGPQSRSQRHRGFGCIACVCALGVCAPAFASLLMAPDLSSLCTAASLALRVSACVYMHACR